MIDADGRYFPLDAGFECWSACPEEALANWMAENSQRERI
jgi:hypothetical protein